MVTHDRAFIERLADDRKRSHIWELHAAEAGGVPGLAESWRWG